MFYLFQSPFGAISYCWDGHQCLGITPGDTTATLTQQDPVSDWLNAYFNGILLPLPPLANAKTAFQQRMREQLLDIPLGAVATYGTLATALHTAPRALGQALSANPLAILIPCHRIIAANGLGGYAYGPVWKQHLIDFECSFSGGDQAARSQSDFGTG